jgi:hypothetical protein
MDEVRLTRSYLETLSTDDLTRLAVRFGLDLPSDLSRVFVISELLEASADGEPEDDDDQLLDDSDAGVVGSLPQGYNETFIGVLLRDPFWAYAFWEIKQADRTAREQHPQFDGYRLRVSPLSGPKGLPQGESFTIPVGVEDGAWYLCLPGGNGWYRVDLLCVIGTMEEVLAHSTPIRVPRGSVSPEALPADGDVPAIFSLSGLEELTVLQSGDRESRHHKRCES